MEILTQTDLEEAALRYGILPFFANNIPGFSVEEMTPPGMLFGGNEYEGCWEWKGPVVRSGTTAYGKFFRRKAGFVSRELLPYFMKMRREGFTLKSGSTDEMVYDIISINGRMTSTDLRESILGKPKKRRAGELPELYADHVDFKPASRHSLEGPLQRLQMASMLCISDFRYKQTKRGERYGWGVAEYSTPEMHFDDSRLMSPASGMSARECLDHIIEHVSSRYRGATPSQLRTLLKF